MNKISTWLIFPMVALLGMDSVRAEYGSECSTPNGLEGKCVPISSCADIEAQLKEIQPDRAQLTMEYKIFLQKSDCGEFDGVRHVCCASSQIQYNSKTMEMLQKLTCGQSTTTRVSHGTEVKLGSRPWMALLHYRTETGDRFLCGGTLISNRYVLTAAHCIAGREDQLYEVRLGEHKISTEEDCIFNGKKKKCADPVKDMRIDKIIMHEEYSTLDIYHDIALIRLEQPVEFTRYIKPICLPITKALENVSRTIENFFVSGWGSQENGSPSDVLLEARVENKERNICTEAFHRDIRNSQICAGGNDLKDSCKGDSGGPLQGPGPYLNPYKIRMVQFGIVSVGVVSCGRAGLPGIYTSVPHYMQWITDKMSTQ